MTHGVASGYTVNGIVGTDVFSAASRVADNELLIWISSTDLSRRTNMRFTVMI